MLDRNRFDYTTQHPFGICVLFTFAKAIDALTMHNISFFDVMKCLYQYTQENLKRPVTQFLTWQDLVRPMLQSWYDFFDLFGKAKNISDLNHDFLANHLFIELSKKYHNIGISCTHPTQYSESILKTKECVLCYPFNHGVDTDKSWHAVAVAYDYETYFVDPNQSNALPFKSLPVVYVGSDFANGDCILLEKV
jgi:hypothetical protein